MNHLKGPSIAGSADLRVDSNAFHRRAFVCQPSPRGRTTHVGRRSLVELIGRAGVWAAVGLLISVASGLGVDAVGPVWAAEVDFLRDVQPILQRHCYRCHGGDHREAGLVLDRPEGLLGRADSDEPIVRPGDPERSWLVKRMTSQEEGELMPLDGEPLPPEDLKQIRQWIAGGATLPETWAADSHWAYTPPRWPELPAVNAITVDEKPCGESDGDGAAFVIRNPVDTFVAARASEQGLPMSAEADPATLARRASLALTGLPPTMQQVQQLVADPSDATYEALVDQWLASPAFGQHWARHWLDLARYADSNGFQADQLRDAWAYRDWVVDAFGTDMPFDRFVVEQLAGDLLPDATASSRIATGFHRTPTCNVEAGVHPEANRVNQVFDRVNTTATVFLGSTLECAQCHDHKYDPFTQADYYRMFAYFNNTPIEVKQSAGVTYDFVGPKMSLPMLPEQSRRLAELEERLKTLKTRRQKLNRRRDFGGWLVETRQALAKGRAQWISPAPQVTTSSDESFTILDDQSVLLDGTLPGTAVYRFEYSGQTLDLSAGPVIGVRLDAMRDPSLPGGGPGRGDAERTNFVLNELTMSVEQEAAREDAKDDDSESISLGQAVASFSQNGFDVGQAIDGDAQTGWAIAPEFDEAHWAEFRTTRPVDLRDGDTLVVTLDQQFGRGRVIGRPKLSFLVGPPATADLTDEVVGLIRQTDPLSEKQEQTLRSFFVSLDPVLSELDGQIRSTETEIQNVEPPTALVMVENDAPRETYVMQRGDYMAKGDRVSAGTPASLHPADESLPENRLGLAQWIVDPANPLLARVTVNRFWMELFGHGIVTTPEDFGTQSEPPSHPKLLDWLAMEFQTNDWSVKQLLKTIVMSSTFRQDSRLCQPSGSQDPENRWITRGPRFRLPAEVIRDNALAISGLLSTDPGGPPVMPYQPDGTWRAIGRNQPKWRADVDDDRYRRGIYVVWKRSAPYPSFVTFDAPDRASCTVQRPRTNTPLQALVLLNDKAYAEAAVAFARRMIREAPAEDPASIAATGYRLATASRPSERAVQVLVSLYRKERASLGENPEDVTRRVNLLPKSFRHGDQDDLEVAAWFAVASTLLNLDATITMN